MGLLRAAASTRILLVLGPALAIMAARAGAQVVQLPMQSEGRLDVLIASTTAVHAGYGVTFPLGLYIRPGIVAGAGIGREGFEGRTDLLARFSFDPFRQSRWAPYGGGGMSARFNSTEENEARVYLLMFLGVEGPLPLGATAGIVPAIEAGFGGGVRLGVVLRRGVNARR